MRPVQRFSEDYLRQTKDITPEQAARFVEDARKLYFASRQPGKTKLISLKVPEALLAAFRSKAASRGARYQTQIKALMEAWLGEP